MSDSTDDPDVYNTAPEVPKNPDAADDQADAELATVEERVAVAAEAKKVEARAAAAEASNAEEAATSAASAARAKAEAAAQAEAKAKAEAAAAATEVRIAMAKAEAEATIETAARSETNASKAATASSVQVVAGEDVADNAESKGGCSNTIAPSLFCLPTPVACTGCRRGGKRPERRWHIRHRGGRWRTAAWREVRACHDRVQRGVATASSLHASACRSARARRGGMLTRRVRLVWRRCAGCWRAAVGPRC